MSNNALYLIIAVWWLSGIALASGWLKLLACVFPLYAMYVPVEAALHRFAGCAP